MGLRRSTCTVGLPRCRACARDAWHQTVCISKTDLCRLSQYVLHLGNRPVPVKPGFYYFTTYHTPSRLHLENRPVLAEPGFYSFTVSLLYCCTNCYFTVFVLYYSTIDSCIMYYFTVYCFTILPCPHLALCI